MIMRPTDGTMMNADSVIADVFFLITNFISFRTLLFFRVAIFENLLPNVISRLQLIFLNTQSDYKLLVVNARKPDCEDFNLSG